MSIYTCSFGLCTVSGTPRATGGPTVLKHPDRWHVGPAYYLHSLIPRFDAFPHGSMALAEWEERGLRLVVLDEHMLYRIILNNCPSLTRNVELEEQVQKLASVEVDNEEQHAQGVLDKDVGVDIKVSMSYVSVWRGSVEDIIRAVLVEDKKRKRGLREYYPRLKE
ncbi:hypothetical protein DM02DRAFT_631998 [Periconia macrospinosa]|uniref:Uncharacterized protein n=1 Tax=Periconia macrospinosa TaxID=97972 RepID=A0A2V1DEL9_9PLEO|nr:hypothetical protein DM02DRAFT_631998 [Periconia macrospinosa]